MMDITYFIATLALSPIIFAVATVIYFYADIKEDFANFLNCNSAGDSSVSSKTNSLAVDQRVNGIQISNELLTDPLNEIELRESLLRLSKENPYFFAHILSETLSTLSLESQSSNKGVKNKSCILIPYTACHGQSDIRSIENRNKTESRKRNPLQSTKSSYKREVAFQ